jgi:hypothetical protein
MQKLNTEKDYKNTASALRRELKALGLQVPSHAQALEILAKCLGASSYAELKAALQPAAQAVVVNAEAPVAEAAPRYRLFNDTGEMDLQSGEGTLVHGLDFTVIEASLDDILECTAGLSGAQRTKNGGLGFSWTGGTEVNWDMQKTRTNERGSKLLVNDGREIVPADECILVPEDFGGDENLMNEELVQEYELPLRQTLVAAVARYLLETGNAEKALQEMTYDDEWGGFDSAFADIAHNLESDSVVAQAQKEVGFLMHVEEFKALREQLLTAVKS